MGFASRAGSSSSLTVSCPPEFRTSHELLATSLAALEGPLAGFTTFPTLKRTLSSKDGFFSFDRAIFSEPSGISLAATRSYFDRRGTSLCSSPRSPVACATCAEAFGSLVSRGGVFNRARSGARTARRRPRAACPEPRRRRPARTQGECCLTRRFYSQHAEPAHHHAWRPLAHPSAEPPHAGAEDRNGALPEGHAQRTAPHEAQRAGAPDGWDRPCIGG